MTKIIIENRSSITDAQSLNHVAKILSNQIDSNYSQLQLVVLTDFKGKQTILGISHFSNKCSDRFVVWDYEGDVK